MDQKDVNNNTGIEHKILGNILVDPARISPLMAFLRPEDFSCSEHQRIYETILSLTKQKQPFDFIMVAEELEKQNKLKEIGGPRYLGVVKE